MRNYYRGEIDDVDGNASDGKSFNYKPKIVGEAPERYPRPENEGNADQPLQPPVPSLNVEVIIPVKHHSNFWSSLDLPLINCKLKFDLQWAKDCVLIEPHNEITGTYFKDLKGFKQEFKRIKFCNKYRSEIKSEARNNNLVYKIHPNLWIFLDCLVFHSKTVTVILQEIILISIIYH